MSLTRWVPVLPLGGAGRCHLGQARWGHAGMVSHSLLCCGRRDGCKPPRSALRGCHHWAQVRCGGACLVCRGCRAAVLLQPFGRAGDASSSPGSRRRWDRLLRCAPPPHGLACFLSLPFLAAPADCVLTVTSALPCTDVGTWRGLPVAVKTMVFEAWEGDDEDAKPSSSGRASSGSSGNHGNRASGGAPPEPPPPPPPARHGQVMAASRKKRRYVRAIMETAIAASVGHRNVVRARFGCAPRLQCFCQTARRGHAGVAALAHLVPPQEECQNRYVCVCAQAGGHVPLRHQAR